MTPSIFARQPLSLRVTAIALIVALAGTLILGLSPGFLLDLTQQSVLALL